MKKIIIFVIAAMVLTGAVFGAAATITVVPGNVGAGTSAALAGYAVTNTAYTLVGSDVSVIKFDITNAPATVALKTDLTAFGNWGCVRVVTLVTCTAVANEPAADIDTVTVVANG